MAKFIVIKTETNVTTEVYEEIVENEGLREMEDNAIRRTTDDLAIGSEEVRDIKFQVIRQNDT